MSYSQSIYSLRSSFCRAQLSRYLFTPRWKYIHFPKSLILLGIIKVAQCTGKYSPNYYTYQTKNPLKWLVKLFHWRSLTHHDISNYYLKIMTLHTSAPDVGRLHIPVCVRIEEDKQQLLFTLHSALRRTGNTTYFSATYTRSHVQFASLNSDIRSPNLYSCRNQWKHLNAKVSFCIHTSSTSELMANTNIFKGQVELSDIMFYFQPNSK